MDTAEDSDVIVRFVRLGHEMHYPLASNSSERLRLLPRSEWRFEAEFSDGSESKQWILWAASEANLKQMAALDTHWHAAEHKLKLPQAPSQAATWQLRLCSY